MVHATYGTGSRGDDGWTSDQWSDPRTVAAPWGPSLAEVPPPAPAARTRARTSGWPRPWVAVGIVLLAMLVGIGATRILVGSEPAARTASPRISAPATLPPAPAPSASDSSAADPNAADPIAPGTPQPGQEPGSGATSGSRALSAIAAKVAPSIVDITTTIGYDGAQAAGTGEILTADGVILTNHHVIAGATAIDVTITATGETFTADVVGYDTSHDIAVIKLRNASGLTPAPIGDSSTVQLGDDVIGLGNAGGVGGQPIEAAGKVTGLDRPITATDQANGTSERLTGLIETDADIQPGDSGGSLIDADATIIGIITAGSVSSGVSGSTDTDGYAVPINQAMQIAQDIRDGKASSTIHIGDSAFLGVQVSGRSSAGVVLNGVVNGSAADKAGMAGGDTITRVDAQRISTPNELRSALAPHHPGDRVSISWTDAAGTDHTRAVTLGTGPVG